MTSLMGETTENESAHAGYTLVKKQRLASCCSARTLWSFTGICIFQQATIQHIFFTYLFEGCHTVRGRGRGGRQNGKEDQGL